MPDTGLLLPAPARASGSRRHVLRPGLDALEAAFDHAFGAAANPWRHLGGLAYLLFWVIAATGIYVYIGFDTRADGAYTSVERPSANAYPLGALARSLHRYASDAFLLVTLLHLGREWIRGRYAHFHRFSWTTGVVTLWLLFASGIGGFWLVWDQLAQYSLVATTEWLDALPVFDGALVRNFIATDAVNDRLFSLLIFLHIGLPLALLGAMWIHVQRLAQPATNPPRTLVWGTLAALALLAVARPVGSDAPANLADAPGTLALDWFYLGIHAFADATSPVALWGAAGGATVLLLALPWLSREARTPRPAAARVDLDNCNGCGRCFVDCPYAAVTMAARTDGRALVRQAVVDADLCAACGICAGACPSSTPFRTAAELVTGIDLPQAPIAALRATLETALARLGGPGGPSDDKRRARIVIFGCRADNGGVDLAGLADARTATIELVCAGQLPPSFVEYALRTNVDGVLVTGCREGDCECRQGNRWTADRLAAQRAPRLRAAIPAERVRVAWAGRGQERALRDTLAAFRAELATAAPSRALLRRPKRLENSDENLRSS